MGWGKFEGDVVAKWLRHSGNDRNMQLLEEFLYVDPDGKKWHAPAGSVINGASIPQALWQTVGPPYVGDYRRASVVHDVACVEQNEPHESVHLMFYNAMRADRVGWTRANVMYQAVKRFGPKWNVADGSLTAPETDDATVLQWIAAVQRAAKQTRQSQGLEAVEARAKTIVLEQIEDAAEPSPAPERRSSSKKTRRVSGVRVIQNAQEPAQGEHTATSKLVRSLPASVRKTFLCHDRLCDFRHKAGIGDAEEQSRHADGCAENDPTLMAAAGVDELEATPHLRLTRQQRIDMLDQALLLIEDNYVHLRLKEAMYAVNPVQSLRLLREQTSQTDAPLISTVQFHRSLAKIFLSTRDLHTNYFLPAPFSRLTAFLPFMVEDFFDENETQDQRRFLVTRVFAGFSAPGFETGVEILRWSGIDIGRAVDINGDRYAGSNPEARRARGLETLTVRPLVQSLPPEEDFVLVEFRDADGIVRELRVEWEIFRPDTNGLAAMGELDDAAISAQGIDLEQSLVRIAKQYLFAPESVVQAEKAARLKKSTTQTGLTSLLPNALIAKSVETSSGEFGYVRIRSFSVNSADDFVEEFVRLVAQLPQEGLIIDVRGNGGGLILAGEQLLQVLTPRRIQPTLFQLRNTQLNRQLVDSAGFLRQWRDSMRQAVKTGAIYTRGFPITSVTKANEIRQQYFGPVVLITDGLCYSTTDIFAAGFQDHDVGVILGVDNNTGAGGANVWDHKLLSSILAGTSSPYSLLPAGAGMRVSMRRTIRVGPNSGTVLEDLGVVPNELYRMTRSDLIDDNVDLLTEAGRILAQRTAHKLVVQVIGQAGGEISLLAQTENIERLDFYNGLRPIGSVDITDSEMEIALEGDVIDQLIVNGFSDGRLVASKRLRAS